MTEQGARAGRRVARRGVGRRIGKVLGVSTLCLVLVTMLTAMYLYRDLNSRITSSNEMDSIKDRALKDPAAGRALNIMILGDDSRTGEGNNIDGLLDQGGGSDTTIVLHISADRSRAYGVSIPRDTIVDRPECAPHGKYKGGPAASNAQWNAAYNVGGPACTIAQFESVSDVRIDHFVVVDFNGMKNMVDAIGGVHMCVPFDLVDNEGTHTTIKAGKNVLLDGEKSRAYVRMRKIENIGATYGSDLARARRQQAFIGAMAKEVLSAGTLTNPIKVRNFLSSTLESLVVDEGLGTINDIAGLAMQFQSIGLDDIQFLTIPVADWPEDPNRVMLAEPNASEVFKALRKDKPIPARLLTGVLRADGGSGVPAKKPGKNKPSATASASPSGSPSGSPSDSATGSASPSPSASRTVKDAVPATIYDDPEKLGLCG